MLRVFCTTKLTQAAPRIDAKTWRPLCVDQPACYSATEEMDSVFALPYKRVPHPAYGNARIPAYEMIRFSVNIMRGCFGGCSFCSITEHEGRIIQSRSEESIINEIEAIRDTVPGFTGVISDLGGPTPTCICCAQSPRAERPAAACRVFTGYLSAYGH